MGSRVRQEGDPSPHARRRPPATRAGGCASHTLVARSSSRLAFARTYYLYIRPYVFCLPYLFVTHVDVPLRPS